MKACGWYVNLRMRRVEPVVAGSSNYNTDTYGKYNGPKRTYMLHDWQVIDTESLALFVLADRMQDLIDDRTESLAKLKQELQAVLAARESLK